jgi:hypothetical protein
MRGQMAPLVASLPQLNISAEDMVLTPIQDLKTWTQVQIFPLRECTVAELNWHREAPELAGGLRACVCGSSRRDPGHRGAPPAGSVLNGGGPGCASVRMSS